MNNNNNIYSIGSVSTGNTNRSSRRLDASNIAMFAENLKFLGQTQEIMKSELTLYKIIPYIRVPVGASVYEYSMYEGTGVGTYTASQAKDIPIVNRIGNKFMSPMATIQIAMDVSEGDIEAALFSRTDHVSRLRDQCLRGLYETMEQTLLRGYKPLGLKGLFDFDDGATAVANNWYDPNTTTQQIYNDIVAAYTTADRNTASMIKPDTMLVTPNLHTLLQVKPTTIGTTYVGMNMLNYIQSELNIKVISCPKLSLQFNNKDRDGFFLLANNSQYLGHPISVEFDATLPQQDAFQYKTYFRSTHGGLVAYHPRAIVARKMTNVPA